MEHTLRGVDSVLCDVPLAGGDVGRLKRENVDGLWQAEICHVVERYNNEGELVDRRMILMEYENALIDSVRYPATGGTVCLFSYGAADERRHDAVFWDSTGTITPYEHDSVVYEVKNRRVEAYSFDRRELLWTYEDPQTYGAAPVYFTPSADGGGLLLSHRWNDSLVPLTISGDDSLRLSLVASRLSAQGDLLWQTLFPSSQSIRGTAAVGTDAGWHISAETNAADRWLSSFSPLLIQMNTMGEIRLQKTMDSRVSFSSFVVAGAIGDTIIVEELGASPTPHSPSYTVSLYDTGHTKIRTFPRRLRSETRYFPVYRRDNGYLTRTEGRSFAILTDSNHVISSPLSLPKTDDSLRRAEIITAVALGDSLIALAGSTPRGELYMETVDSAGTLLLQKRWPHRSETRVLAGAANRETFFFAGYRGDALWAGGFSMAGEILWEQTYDSSLEVVSAESTQEGWLLLCTEERESADMVGVLLHMNHRGKILSRREEPLDGSPSLIRTGGEILALFPFAHGTGVLHIDRRGATIRRSQCSLQIKAIASYGAGYSAVLSAGGTHCLLDSTFSQIEGGTIETGTIIEGSITSIQSTFAAGNSLFQVWEGRTHIPRLGWKRKVYFVQIGPGRDPQILKSASLGNHYNSLQLLPLADDKWILLNEGRDYYHDGFGPGGIPTFSAGPLRTSLSLWSSRESVNISPDYHGRNRPVQEYTPTGLSVRQSGSLFVYTSSGRLVRRMQDLTAGTTISLSMLPAGIYLSRFVSRRGVHQMKFQVQP
jgi:hypothetical protein